MLFNSGASCPSSSWTFIFRYQNKKKPISRKASWRCLLENHVDASKRAFLSIKRSFLSWRWECSARSSMLCHIRDIRMEFVIIEYQTSSKKKLTICVWTLVHVNAEKRCSWEEFLSVARYFHRCKEYDSVSNWFLYLQHHLAVLDGKKQRKCWGKSHRLCAVGHLYTYNGNSVIIVRKSLCCEMLSDLKFIDILISGEFRIYPTTSDFILRRNGKNRSTTTRSMPTISDVHVYMRKDIIEERSSLCSDMFWKLKITPSGWELASLSSPTAPSPNGL